MERGEREIILKAINLFKKNKSQFQKNWLILAIEEDIPLHKFMDFKAFIKSYFGCPNKIASALLQIIIREFESMKKHK